MTKNKPFSSYLKNPAVYLPYLAAPLAIAAVYLFVPENTTSTGTKPSPDILDEIGPFLIGSATAIYWFKTLITRNLTYVILLAFAACLFLRELHWMPMQEGATTIKDAIFPLLGGCVLWMIVWRKVIDGAARNFSHTLFFIPALVTYALGQAIEKRIFRGILPREADLHTFFEEAVECCAHSLILMAAIFGSWQIRRLVIEMANED